jgi:hypothetical protein
LIWGADEALLDVMSMAASRWKRAEGHDRTSDRGYAAIGINHMWVAVKPKIKHQPVALGG